MTSLLVATEYADATPWGVAAGITFGLWLALFTYVAMKTRPSLPQPGPETMELGPERPAVAGFATARWKVLGTSVAATLVDLAARGHFALDQIGDGRHLVRVRDKTTDGLTEYERQVLALVHTKAVNGTVPAAELTLGYGNASDKWWKTFSRGVIDDARARGLVRRRFSTAQLVLLAATSLVPAFCVGMVLEVFGTAARGPNVEYDSGAGPVFAVVFLPLLLFIPLRLLRGWRETPAGSDAAGHWLGVRDYLRHDDAFRDTPPAGVAIWQRLLAYGVALGVAHGTATALPIGPTRDDAGWSPQRGIWREVTIEYPKRFRYGAAPKAAALISALALVLNVGALVLLGIVTADAIDTFNGGGRFFVVTLLIPMAFCVMQVGRAVVVLRRALPDLSETETFDGYVVRVPWHLVQRNDDSRWEPTGYVAVDDGTSDEVRALRYGPGGIKEGQRVRVTLTPRMRHVVDISPL